jgi:hypothetical protein
MATKEQIRGLTRAIPFRPFRVKLAGGQTFTVRHPENIACDLKGRGMTIYDGEGMHLLEMLRVELVEDAPSPSPAQPPQTNSGGGDADDNGEGAPT